jgi:hypothetical protein
MARRGGSPWQHEDGEAAIGVQELGWPAQRATPRVGGVPRPAIDEK